MSATLTVTTVQLPLAIGQVLADWVFTVSTVADPATVFATQNVATPVAVFDLAPGDYTATAQRVDSTGAVFGNQVHAAFTIPPVVMGEAAGSLAVTLS